MHEQKHKTCAVYQTTRRSSLARESCPKLITRSLNVNGTCWCTQVSRSAAEIACKGRQDFYLGHDGVSWFWCQKSQCISRIWWIGVEETSSFLCVSKTTFLISTWPEQRGDIHRNQSEWELMKMKNHRRPRLPVQECAEESHESRQTRTWRFGTCCLQKLVCCLCRRKRSWWTTSNWTVSGRGTRKNNSDGCFWLLFHDTRKCRHVSDPDLSRQQTSVFVESFWSATMNRVRRVRESKWFHRDHNRADCRVEVTVRQVKRAHCRWQSVAQLASSFYSASHE